MKNLHYDVIVIGAGSAGVSAAATAAKCGKRTLLIEAGAMPGGELLSGMPVDGAVNARGEWIQGGVTREFFDECERLGGYIGPINDHRLIHYVAFDPEIMKVAVVNVLNRYGVDLLLHTYVYAVKTKDGSAQSIALLNKGGKSKITASVFLDCSGDGDVAMLAGADFVKGDGQGHFQPISLMFRLSGVETNALLEFARAHPESLALGESDAIRQGRTDEELAESLYQQGQPSVFFKGEGPLMAEGIKSEELFPTALIMIQPTSASRREVCLNATRVANVDATDTPALSRTIGLLMEQVMQCTRFMQKYVPGFQDCSFAGISPRLGIRETRRIVGEYALSQQEVLNAQKSEQGVAKGCHHVDIHQDGTGQIRIPVANGGSYDIPFGCLLPKKLDNVLVAGRCVSADREAHGSMRVMGSCMGMGQAIGAAASLYIDTPEVRAFREIPVEKIQNLLRSMGAVLEGTA